MKKNVLVKAAAAALSLILAFSGTGVSAKAGNTKNDATNGDWGSNKEILF